jgi:hypothetical protein
VINVSSTTAATTTTTACRDFFETMKYFSTSPGDCTEPKVEKIINNSLPVQDIRRLL